LARERLRQLGILGLELAYVWQRSVLDVLATISVVRGKALINDAIAKGNGVILLIPHIGNWEVLGNYIGHHFSTTAMFQPSDNQALDAMIRRSRERCGSTLVPTNTSGVKKLLRALKGGECVAILPDQVPPKGSGIFAPFFKLPALTMTLVYNLVQRTGASVVVGYARRMDDGSFEMVFEAVADNISSADELSSVCALNAAVEQCVNKIPEQYQWEYKRFRKQPQGAKKYYQKK
jgi:KDO2-lipid IV(A) lauroyltransferase